MRTSPNGVIQWVSHWPFDKTLARITQAIVDADMIIFTCIDHAAGARQFGFSLPATTVVIYGHPRAGTPALFDSPVAALELPLRVLVHEEGGQVLVTFHPIRALLMNAGVSRAVAEKLEPGQRVILDVLERGSPWSTLQV